MNGGPGERNYRVKDPLALSRLQLGQKVQDFQV